MNIRWDAHNYADQFSFVPRYGNDVIDLIDFEKAKTAVDLGCGNGVLTAALKERKLAVTGVDASEEMLALARQNFPDIPFLCADATSFLPTEKVDVYFSNAMAHWIDADKQQDMLNHIAAGLNDGGQLVMEFGGRGCAESIHSALEKIFSEYGYHYQRTFFFPTVGEYAPMVERAGLQVRCALLFERPTPLNGENGLRDWIKMFLKAPFSVISDPALQEKIITRAEHDLRAKLLKDRVWYVDYVRIRIKAVKDTQRGC